MADVTPVDGSRILQALPGLMIELVQVETATNGEDGVTFTVRMSKILDAFVTSNEDAKTGAFTISWSGSTVTVKSILGTQGDEATVSVMVVGY